MQAFIILGGAFLLVVGLKYISPFIDDWWRSLFIKPLPAILLMAAMVSTVIGTGESADISRIQSGLPDIYRLLRAVINFSIFFISLGGIINSPVCWKFAGAGAKWTLLYALFAVASTLWSVAPFLTLWKSFEVLNLVLLAIYLSGYLRTVDDVRWLLNIACMCGLYILMTIYMGVLVYPQESLLGIDESLGAGYLMVRGLIPIFNPSSVGVLAAIIAIFAIVPVIMRYNVARYKNKTSLWLIIVISVALLMLARSRTQMIAFAISLICVLVFARRRVFALILASTGVIAFVASELVIAYFLRGQSYDQFSKLTGRLSWWEEAIQMGLDEAPLLGKGLYAAQRMVFHTNVLDSTYVEAFFGLGLIGLVLLIIPLLIMTYTLMASRPLGSKFQLIDLLWMQSMAIFVILAVRSITVSTFVGMHFMLVFYVVLHIASAALHRMRRNNIEPQVSNISMVGEQRGRLLSRARN